MAHQPYPPFSSECLSDLYRLVTTRAVREELPLFAKCLYTLIGASLGMSIGEPTHVEGVFGDAEPDAAELEKCRDALQSYADEGQTFGADGDEAEKLDPATIAMLIQLAVTLISKWLERRRT